MIHLSTNNLEEIDNLATVISRRGAYTKPDPYYLSICNKEVSVKIVNANCKTDLSNNGASLNYDTPTISLQLAGLRLCDDSGGAKMHVTSLLVHEATHFFQLRMDCFTQIQIFAAGQYRNTYKNINSLENYINYVRCDVEMPAHAAQLAFELRDNPELEQDPTDSNLYKHFQKRCGNPEDETDIISLFNDITGVANEINTALNSASDRS